MREVSSNTGIDADERLVLAAKAGDKPSFGRLVELNQSPVRSFLRSLSHQDAELADDLAQDTFITAYRQIGSYRGEGTFLSWLMGIAYRQFLLYARKRKRRNELLEGVTNLPGYSRHEEGILKIDVERALSRLSVQEKTAILLNSREGFAHSEIASIMELPLGTVKSHINRGRDKLKHILSGQESGNE
jgi:RNA polymerase sigma-70 factor (ECF subfamily)